MNSVNSGLYFEGLKPVPAHRERVSEWKKAFPVISMGVWIPSDLPTAAVTGTQGEQTGCLEGIQMMSSTRGNLGFVFDAKSLGASGKMQLVQSHDGHSNNVFFFLSS